MKTSRKNQTNVALFHEFLVLKSEKREMDELTPQGLNKVSGFHYYIYIYIYIFRMSFYSN